MKRLLIPILLFALFVACKESDQCRAINYEPNASRNMSYVTIQACFDNNLQPIEGYLSICVFLDPEFQRPWRAFAGNNICWAYQWEMLVPSECWIVVFIDSEPFQPPEDEIIDIGPYPWNFRTRWDGIPDFGDPYHPTIIHHGMLRDADFSGELVEDDLVIHYELGYFDRSYRWGMPHPS